MVKTLQRSVSCLRFLVEVCVALLASSRDSGRGLHYALCELFYYFNAHLRRFRNNIDNRHVKMKTRRDSQLTI